VFDVSRWVNVHVQLPHVKLTHVHMPWLEIGILPSKDAFRFHSLLGSFSGLAWRDQIFCVQMFAFGLNSAVHILTKLWKLILGFLHRKGIAFSIYVDDGIMMASTQDQVDKDLAFVDQTLDNAGSRPEKCHTVFAKTAHLFYAQKILNKCAIKKLYLFSAFWYNTIATLKNQDIKQLCPALKISQMLDLKSSQFWCLKINYNKL